LSLTEKEQSGYLRNEHNNKIINMKTNCLSCSSMENTKIILSQFEDDTVRLGNPYLFTANNYQRGHNNIKTKYKQPI